MTGKEWAKEAASVAAATAKNVVIKDALAKSAAKGYTDTGARAGKNRGKEDTRLVTKQDVIEKSISVATIAAPFLAKVAGMKISQARAKKAENEARFNSWGGRILTEKVSNVINLSSDQWKVVN